MNNRGNVLFLILIAVALFAALAYAVTGSTRSSDGNAKNEKVSTVASAILNHAASLQAGMQRMQLSSSCADDQYDFSNPIYLFQDGSSAMLGNVNSPSDDRCDLYSSRGGGVIPYIIPVEYTGASYSGSTYPKVGHALIRVGQIPYIGTDGASGTESANDIFFSFYYLSKELCVKLNDILGVPNPSGDAPSDSTTGGSNGGYVDGSLAGSRIYNDPNIAGKAVYCAKGSPAYYYFKVVLRAR